MLLTRLFVSIFFVLCYSTSVYLLATSIRIKPNISEGPIGVVIHRDQSQLHIKFSIDSDFGIQKKAGHYIRLYELKKKAKNIVSVKEKIKKYGTRVEALKVFKGITSPQDNKYYITVKDWLFATKINKKKQYALEGRIFYCSFKKKYCSLKKFYELL